MCRLQPGLSDRPRAVVGTIILEDEMGTKKTVEAGDTFVIHRGSTVAFSSSDYGIAFKCGSRLMARL